MKTAKILSIVAALAIAASSTSALGASKTCVPSRVAFGSVWSGQMRLECGSMTFWSFANRSGCPFGVRDDMKNWLSIIETALLSGKNVEIYYDWSGGSCNNNIISWVDLVR